MPLTNSQYNALMRVYEEKRAKSRDLANLHYERACQKVPELASIDASISSASLDQAKKLLAGDNTALASLKEDIRSLSDRRRRLLSDAGFPEDYLEQHFECPDCQDTGYLDGRKCRCFQKAEIDLLYTQSNLQDILESENFSYFRMDYYSSDFIDPVSGKSSLDMAKEADRLGDQLEARFGRRLTFGTGIHTGPAVVGNVGAPDRMDYTAIGDTVNTASRLESNAPGGKIYISAAVANALEGRINAKAIGSIRLKGKAGEFQVLELEGLTEGSSGRMPVSEGKKAD